MTVVDRVSYPDGYYYTRHNSKEEAGDYYHIPDESQRIKTTKEVVGLKYDIDKPRTHLVFQDFADALLEVAKVGTHGAAKYDDHNWLSVDNGFERYSSAMIRHYLAENEDYFDDDSGYLHAAHAAWNALARLQLILNQHKADNQDD